MHKTNEAEIPEIICITSEYDKPTTKIKDVMDLKVVYVVDKIQKYVRFTHKDDDHSDAIDPESYIELIKHEIK